MSDLSRHADSHDEMSNKFVMGDISEMMNSSHYISKLNDLNLYDGAREEQEPSLEHSASSPFITNPESGSDNISVEDNLLSDSRPGNEQEYERSQMHNFSRSKIENEETSQKSTMTEGHIDDEPHSMAEHANIIGVLDETFLSEMSSGRDEDKDQLGEVEEPTAITQNRNRSPWRNLRSASTTSKLGNLGKIPSLHFHDLTPGLRKSVGTNKYEAASSFSRVYELNKEITGYRIQIKFFKQFLSDLIDRSGQIDGLVQGSLDMGEIAKLRGTVNEVDSQNYEKDLLEVQEKYEALTKNYDEIYNLNQDLYNNLETFEHNLKSKEEIIQNLQQYTQDCEMHLDGILDDLIKNASTDPLSRQALLKCQNSHGAQSLSSKAQVIKSELEKTSDSRTKTKYPSPPSSNRERYAEDRTVHTQLIQSVLSSLERIQNNYADSKSETKRLEAELKSEIASSKTVMDNNALMQETLKGIRRSIEGKPGRNTDDSHQLESENRRLLSSFKDMEVRYFEYKKLSEDLQEEVTALRNSRYSILGSRRDSSFLSSTHDFGLQGELLNSHKDYKQLNQDYIQLSTELNRIKHESTEKITNLKNDLQSKQHELHTFKANEKSYENLKHDLEIAVEKQRIYKAENIRLSYNVETLTNDKISLSSTIKSLTDKIALLTLPSSQEKSDNGMKKLNILEYQLEDLIFFDVQEFQRLLKSFNKIADDSSLKEPKRKVDSLTKKFARDDRGSGLDVDNLNVVRDYHKSVFNYFARAVDIIINDHVKLLLKQNDPIVKNDAHVQSMISQIDHLRAENESLSKKLNQVATSRESSASSPRYQVRIDELTSRWKAEREARVYENKESLRRLEELEAENAKLKSRS